MKQLLGAHHRAHPGLHRKHANPTNPLGRHPVPRILRQSIDTTYAAATAFVTSNNELFPAVTLGGKIFRLIYAFGILLIIAAYTANLTTLLVIQPEAKAVINSVSRAPPPAGSRGHNSATALPGGP